MHACQVHEREREIAGMEAAHKASVALLEEQLLNAESRLARESEQCRSLEHRCGFALCACARPSPYRPSLCQVNAP